MKVLLALVAILLCGCMGASLGSTTCTGRRYSDLPLHASRYDWESKAVFNPTAIVVDSLVHMFYRAEDWAAPAGGTGHRV